MVQFAFYLVQLNQAQKLVGSTQEQITTSNVDFASFGFPTPTLPFNKPERNVDSGTVAGNILRTCNLRELVDVKNIELFTCQDTNGFRCSVYLETKKD